MGAYRTAVHDGADDAAGVGVDYPELYACVVEESAITPEIIDTYAPSLRTELLPGRAVAK